MRRQMDGPPSLGHFRPKPQLYYSVIILKKVLASKSSGIEALQPYGDKRSQGTALRNPEA